MVEAVFDFASINRRMNRKPNVIVATEPQSQKETVTYQYIDPAKKGSDQTFVFVAHAQSVGRFKRSNLEYDKQRQRLWDAWNKIDWMR